MHGICTKCTWQLVAVAVCTVLSSAKKKKERDSHMTQRGLILSRPTPPPLRSRFKLPPSHLRSASSRAGVLLLRAASTSTSAAPSAAALPPPVSTMHCRKRELFYPWTTPFYKRRRAWLSRHRNYGRSSAAALCGSSIVRKNQVKTVQIIFIETFFIL